MTKEKQTIANYPFAEIEQKWQRFWDENQTFRIDEDSSVPEEKRRYVLDMFPYPSSEGLHVGHPEGYTATDIYCRHLRMKGYHVLHPMGFDSFGLPAENYAIKTGTHPRISTERNIERFEAQIRSFGFCYDWNRRVSTHDANYYRWTQWIFLKLWEHDLAYEAEVPINWCPSCLTGLANEEVKDGACERCSTEVARRDMRQWMLRITKYADHLLADLDQLDWPESLKLMQRNWIGRSEGANVRFPLSDRNSDQGYIEVFTTRPDTLFGATYMVLAPEHELVDAVTTAACRAEVRDYVLQARRKSDLERTDLAKQKTGVFTGGFAINPVNNERIPIWISDYILISYGTGAIMAVPGHDQRDFDFAKRYHLAIVEVVSPDGNPSELEQAFVGDGISLNSAQFTGLTTPQTKPAIVDWLSSRGLAEPAVNYKLRDWVFSRQRYWGEPIPLVHCQDCGTVAVPYEELPLALPEVESYEPTGTGESPLASLTDWIVVDCPQCGRPAKRETNTMPQWAGSCWYYLRYLDPKNESELASREKIEYWMPVDLYVGGAEHAVLHLLYARFWHKFLHDIGVVNTREPFTRLVNQGMILGEGGEKMSKSKGNVVNPDSIIASYGADAMRIYEMFMGPLEVSKPWSAKGIAGVKRFIDRLWRLSQLQTTREPAAESLTVLLHKTIKKISLDTDKLDFNTAIAQMMVYVGELMKLERLHLQLWEPFVLLLAPYAPHLAEELWEKAGNSPSVAVQEWPNWIESLTRDREITAVFQINGKIRARVGVAAGLAEEELAQRALGHERIAELLRGKRVVKVITVPDKLVNIVVKA